MGKLEIRFCRSMVASTLQCGHWKSLKSTITTGAPGVPKARLERRLQFIEILLERVVGDVETLPCRIRLPSLVTYSNSSPEAGPRAIFT